MKDSIKFLKKISDICENQKHVCKVILDIVDEAGTEPTKDEVSQIHLGVQSLHDSANELNRFIEEILNQLYEADN